MIKNAPFLAQYSSMSDVSSTAPGTERTTTQFPGQVTKILPAEIDMSVGSFYRSPFYQEILQDSVPVEKEYLLSERAQNFEEKDFRSRLINVLEEKPVEDEIPHDAERIIHEALEKFPKYTPIWIFNAFVQTLEHPSLTVGLLQSVGWLDYNLIKDIAESLVINGLANPNFEVREAAIGAVEQWEKKELLGILRYHKEPESLLAKYIEQVVGEIEEDLEVIEIRDISEEQAKEEVRELLEDASGFLDLEEIADKLRLDLRLVYQVSKELIEEGVVEIE